nr:ATP-binding protein [Lachnospiraceae bacterium]
VGKEILAKGSSVLYVSAPQFMDICEKKMKDRTLTSRNDYELLSKVDLLIIDDLGTEIKSSVTVSNLLECINSRIQQNKSTIISTNYTLNDLEQAYNERFISRIVENYALLRLTGKDIRIQKNL